MNLDYSYKPKARDDYSEDAFTFRHANVLISISAAQLWFGGKMVELKQAIGKSQAAVDFPEWTDEMQVSATLLNSGEIFRGAKRLAWSKSKFATLFSENLAGLGATIQIVPCPQDNSLDIISGTWGLSNGKQFALMGEVWIDSKSGKEFVYWFFDALIRTRPAYSQTSTQPSTLYFLPYLFQSCGYLSETMFPSVPIVMQTREKAFGFEDLHLAPQLAFHTEENYFHLALTSDGNQLEVNYFWTPETTRYGYIFEEVEDLSPYLTAMSVATDALPKVADILVDGYSNFPSESEIPFQNSCYADSTIFEQGELRHFEEGIFIPGPIYVEMEIRTIQLYAKSQEVAQTGIQRKNAALLIAGLNGYQEIISKGVGAAIAHAANSYVYTQTSAGNTLLALSDEAKAGFKDYAVGILNFVTRLPVDLQDANACSNLAIIEVSRQNFKEALDAVNLGINKLKENRRHFPHSMMGNSVPELNPGVKLELFATKAELLYRSGNKAKAKEIANDILEDAKASNHGGPEIEKAKWIIAN
jgi:hypothetical protein